MPIANRMGSALRKVIVDECHIETDPEILRRVDSISERIHSARPAEAPRFSIVIPWLDGVSAFTCTGDSIYLSRRLLDHLPHDDQVAFVIAHEIAHHDLGHATPVVGAPRLGRLDLLGEALELIESRVRIQIDRHEKEFAADALALELCIDAGYAPALCLEAFQVFEMLSLDVGMIDAALGTLAELEDQLSGSSGTVTWARRSMEKLTFTHPPIRARVERLNSQGAQTLPVGRQIDNQPDRTQSRTAWYAVVDRLISLNGKTQSPE